MYGPGVVAVLLTLVKDSKKLQAVCRMDDFSPVIVSTCSSVVGVVTGLLLECWLEILIEIGTKRSRTCRIKKIISKLLSFKLENSIPRISTGHLRIEGVHWAWGRRAHEIREWGANGWALISFDGRRTSNLLCRHRYWGDQQQQTSSIRSITRRRPTAQIGRRRRSDGSIEKIGRKKDRPIGSEIETQGIDCKRPDSTTSSWLSLVCLWWSRAIQLASKTSSEIALY